MERLELDRVWASCLRVPLIMDPSRYQCDLGLQGQPFQKHCRETVPPLRNQPRVFSLGQWPFLSYWMGCWTGFPQPLHHEAAPQQAPTMYRVDPVCCGGMGKKGGRLELEVGGCDARKENGGARAMRAIGISLARVRLRSPRSY